MRTRSGRNAGEASIAWRKIGGPPALVTRSRSIRSSASSGVQTSTYTPHEPVISGCSTNVPMPPMCVTGNCRSPTSSGRVPLTMMLTRANAPSVEGVWSTPFGSAVVPDV